MRATWSISYPSPSSACSPTLILVPPSATRAGMVLTERYWDRCEQRFRWRPRARNAVSNCSSRVELLALLVRRRIEFGSDDIFSREKR
jgi:hypothetical protein